MINYDQFGQAHCSTEHIVELLYEDPSLDISHFFTIDPEQYNSAVKTTHSYHFLPSLKKYVPRSETENITVEEFDRQQQNNWHMPDEYKDFPIVEWLLQQCKTQDQLQRVGQELLLYQQMDLMNLLRYMKYMVDTFRKNGIVWGVGRGSSVSSYVLFLIGVHKIDSLYYDLDIEEFLKPGE